MRLILFWPPAAQQTVRSCLLAARGHTAVQRNVKLQHGAGAGAGIEGPQDYVIDFVRIVARHARKTFGHLM
ncbi:MAG: hypothetical protein U0Q18_07375 [Bryobacteraceae bacterium]